MWIGESCKLMVVHDLMLLYTASATLALKLRKVIVDGAYACGIIYH